jgi:hypothetical protein
MSNEIFLLSIAAIALLGFALSIHLIFFGKNKVPAKTLGWYTLLLTLSSLEPLKPYLATGTKAFEVLVAVGSFMIAPMLFLYCKYRVLQTMPWRNSNILHFAPAGILCILLAATPQPTAPVEESSADVVLYLLFIGQVFTYSVISFSLIWKEKRRGNPLFPLQQFHLNFVLFLVIGSITMFVYSFASTLLGLNTSFQFKLSIQAVLTLIIIFIVLLNAETLENHELRRNQSKTSTGK